MATYSYDTFGTPTIWESFTTGWHNPYLYDGRDGARYDSETGLYWLSVRAYDPSLGRFLSRDPLGRAPLFFDASQPYVYGGNNPLTNVDPSGQMFARQMFDGEMAVARRTYSPVRVLTTRGRTIKCTDHSLEPKCAPYVQAVAHDKWRRETFLDGKKANAARFIFFGSVAGAIIDGIEFFGRSDGFFAKVAEGIDLASDLANALSWFPYAFNRPDLVPTFYNLLKIANAVAASLKGLVVLFRSLGALAQWAIDKGLIVAQGLLKGLPGFLESLAIKLAGNTILDLIAGAGHAAAAYGYSEWADYQAQENMDLGM